MLLRCRVFQGLGIFLHRMWRATINSWRGILAAARSDLAMRQELAVLAISIPLALFLTPDFGERLALVGSLLFIIIVELLNTAIEKLADRVTREQDPAIGRIKDMGSAAVGLSLLLAGAIWLWVLIKWFWV
jgi:diacylglycerol kinase (ATP)